MAWGDGRAWRPFPLIMQNIDTETIGQIIQSLAIMAVALGLFFGLKGRIQAFAEWAGLPRLAFTPVRVILRWSILIIAALLILGRWGFQTNGFLAVIGSILGLVAIGFVALWSVLSNFLCTMVLVIFKPFSVGDEIEFPASGTKGRVVDLSLIFTTLETAPGETVHVPNNMFFQNVFKRRAGKSRIGLGEQLSGENLPARS